jgi:hypothetical protein
VSMPSTLPFFFPSSTWTWIASLDIINVFHLGLPHPHSYQHIPYVLRVKFNMFYTSFSSIGHQSI